MSSTRNPYGSAAGVYPLPVAVSGPLFFQPPPRPVCSQPPSVPIRQPHQTPAPAVIHCCCSIL